MEDSFKVRVERAFGTLSVSSSSDVSASLWSLTDEEIERREWNRSKDDEVEVEKEPNRSDAVTSRTFISSNQLDSDLKELSDGEDEDVDSGSEDDVIAEKGARRSDGGASDEFFDVRESLGRDGTLDYEEEEDEYDKVAIGKDHGADRLYTRDTESTDYRMQKELPSSFTSAVRDPRANHEAAYARLKEDSEASVSFDTLQLSDKAIDPNIALEANHNNEHHLLRAGYDLISTRNDRATLEQTSEVTDYRLGIPDYIKNPTRYTHYTLDSTDDMDDSSNRNAYAEFFNSLRKKESGNSRPSNHGSSDLETPTSVVFVPRRKKSDGGTTMRDKNDGGNKRIDAKNEGGGPSLVLTVDDAQEAEVSAMEEDDEQPSVVNKGFISVQKSSGRRFRTKTRPDVDHDMRG